jgi:rhamnosyl/mannosyltransferase
MSDDRMKVLHVGKFYPPHMGGIETHVQVLCRELQKQIEVEVLVANETRRTEEFFDDQLKVTRLATQLNFSGAPVCLGLPGQIRRAKADIVHLHLPNPLAILSLLASGYRGQVVATYHSDIVRQERMARAFDPILRLFLKRCAAVVATSARYLETSTVLADYSDRCRIIPYGIPLDQFTVPDAAQVARIRQRYGSRLIMSAGRLVYYKGFEYLVQAMRHVEGHLLIVGEGPLRESLESESRALGLENKITFLGEIHNQDIAPFFHAADVFALASVARSEAFGIVQLEAMACGTPVVNTNLDSGVPSVSLDRVTGLTVSPGDPVALAAAINELLDDPGLCATFGHAARARAEEQFNQQAMVERTLKMYRQVLEAPLSQTSLVLAGRTSDATASAPELDQTASI